MQTYNRPIEKERREKKGKKVVKEEIFAGKTQSKLIQYTSG